MAHKRKSVHLTTGSAGQAATGTIDFGQTYARVNRLSIVADSSNGWDNSSDFVVTDADGRTIFSQTAVDSTTAAGNGEAAGFDTDWSGEVFKGPATVTVSNAGNTKGGTVALLVEI